MMILAQNMSQPEELQQNAIHMTGVSFAVVDQYQDMIYRTALTMTRNHADAEDVLQEVFFKYFRLKPAFESESHQKAWFLRVTINECKNLMRSVWKRCRSELNFELYGKPENETQEDTPVLRAVMKLPEKYRIVIYLYYYEEYSVREISGITGQSEAAVSQQLVRGRKKLRKSLEGGES